MSEDRSLDAPREDGSGRTIATGAVFFLTSAVLRCVFVASVWSHPAVRYPAVDGRAYNAKAMEILRGNWLGDSVFYQDPLSPYFFAGLYAVFGVGSLGTLMAQAVLGAVTVLLIYLIALRMFGERCALIAGVLATFYELFFYYDALLLKVNLTVFLITLALYLTLEAGVRDLRRLWFGAGCALGVATLTRGNYLIFIPVLLAWIALAGTGAVPARIRRIALISVGASIFILPVTLRNYVVGDDLVLVTSQTGQNLYIGNFRGNTTGRYKAPPFVRGNPFFEETDFRQEGELRNSGRAMKPSELSRFWFHETIAEIRADPNHFVRHTWLKTRMLLNQYEVPDNNSYYFFREEVTPVFKLPGPTFGALLPLALCGMFFARRRRGAPLAITFFATYALTIILSFNMSRYRMPLVPVVILFASFGILHLARLLADSRWREAAFTGAFLAVCYPLVHQDLGHDHFAINHLNIAAQYVRQHRVHYNRALIATRAGNTPVAERERKAAAETSALAEQQLRRGLAIQPDHPPLRTAMGELLLARIQARRDAREFEKALATALDLTETLPRFADGEAALGRVYSDLGRYSEAREALSRALELSPEHPTARAELEFVNSLQPTSEP